jgi:hypothetical protein
VLFTFPSRYLFAIGLPVVFSLTRWSWQIQTGFLVPRLTQGTARFVFLSCTGLSPSLTGFSKTVPLQNTSPYRSPTTPAMPKHHRFGLFPFRSPLLWESLLFSFPVGNEMFQFPTFASWLPRISIAGWVAPFGYLRIDSYLPIPAAFRSLSRPSSPLGAKASSVRP